MTAVTVLAYCYHHRRGIKFSSAELTYMCVDVQTESIVPCLAPAVRPNNYRLSAPRGRQPDTGGARDEIQASCLVVIAGRCCPPRIPQLNAHQNESAGWTRAGKWETHHRVVNRA